MHAFIACMVSAMVTRPSQTKQARARRRRPIQLAALRGFEASARHLSFTLAADELALTQSSISRQVAAMESQVGRALFVRKTRALELTADGRQLHMVVAQALAGIDRCVDEIRGLDQPPRIGLTTYASFASLWLGPRLAVFQRQYPEIEIRVDASDRVVDLTTEGLDLAIRRCLPSRLGDAGHATQLCEEFATPALSPQLLERAGTRLRKPADLQHLPLIEMDDERWQAWRAGGWARWFDSVGVPPQPASGGKLIFGFVDQAMQAAVRGQGVVMGLTPMLADAVASGQLVTPFPRLVLDTGYRYYLIVRPERAAAPEVAAFVRWIGDEFARRPQPQG
jgi:LysR family glycine cleavage system transcriptional activator